MSGLPFVTLNDAAPQDMNESPTVCVGLHLAYHHRNIQHACFQTGLVTSERASMFVLSLSLRISFCNLSSFLSSHACLTGRCHAVVQNDVIDLFFFSLLCVLCSSSSSFLSSVRRHKLLGVVSSAT